MGDFQIPFNKDLIENGVNGSIDITLPDASLAPTLVNQPFPRKNITFASVNASVAGQTDLAFKTVRGDVGFKGSGNASALVAIFPNPNDATSAVAIDSDVPLGLGLPVDAAGTPTPTHYDVIRFGFDANASVSGKVALGANGAITFGASGTADAISAVIRRFNDNALIGRDELIGTAANWRLPSQVQDKDSLDPRTWIVAEVEGSLDLSLGAEYGLNYNWVRSVKLGGLTGDIGLKLQAGISATLGFNVAGKYVVVVSRESDDPKVRVRVYKLAKNGFDFAFDAGLSAQADTSGLTPDKVDDFIKAVLGVHGAQIINDLQAIDQWTGSQESLSGLLAQAGNDYVIKLVKDLTGIDVVAEAAKLTQAKTQILNFINKWTDLSKINSDLATRLLKFVEQNVDLGPITQAAGILANGNAAQLTQFLAGEITQAGFPQTPLAQFLETAAGDGILSLLQQSPAFNQAKTAATAVLGVLDGSTIQQVLTNLEQRLEQTLGLNDLITAVKNGLQMADFQSLDKLLQAKLAALIDKALNALGLSDLDTIRKAIGTFLDKRQAIYQEAVNALNHVYKAEFTATYESSSTGTALLDIEFDFAQDAGGTFATLMRSAIDGKFADIAVPGGTVNLLMDKIPGVTVRQAALTHDIVRHSHQELHLPYFINVADHVNTGQASFVASDGTRVLMSQGKDVVSDSSEFQKNKNRRDSTLSVLVQFGAGNAGQINVHDISGLSFSYQLRQATANTTTEALTRQVQPYVGSFFGPLFSADQRLTLADLIRGIDQAAGGRSNRLGTTLVSLDLSAPPKFGSAWFQPAGEPGDEDARLGRMSRAIQTAMRRIIPYVHFQDVSKFNLSPVCSAYLLYASCPAIAQKNFNFFFPFFPVSDLLNTILGQSSRANLADRVQAVSAILANTPGGDPSGFGPTAVDRITNDASTQDTTQRDLLGFFGMESSIIGQAIAARKDLQGFQANLATNPDQAIASLAAFSANLVDAFNNNVGKFAEPNEQAGIRSLGTLVFLEACLALSGSDDPALLPNAFAGSAPGQAVATAGVQALLEIDVLKPTATVPDNFFTGADPVPSDTLIETRVFNQLLRAAGAGI